MRLIHLAHYPAPYAGSFVPMLLSVLGAARKRGWSVEAILGDDAEGLDWLEEFSAAGLRLRFLPLEPRGRRRGEVARMLDEEAGPAVLHTHFSGFDRAAARAARDRPETRVFWHLHSPARRDVVGVLRNMVKFRTAGRRVDRILCVAPDLADTVEARGGPRGRVLYFPNAIDTARFRQPSEEERQVARARLGLPADGRIALHFGWDWERKGGDLFLAAVRIARERLDESVVGVTVGAGEAARSLGAELGLGREALVILPIGPQVTTLYAAANVFVSPSRAEGMPFSVVEALCSGTAVVATAIPGQAALDAGLGALRLTGFDPAEIAAEICSVLGRPSEAVRSDSEAARAWARTEMDLAPWSARLMALYDEVLES